MIRSLPIVLISNSFDSVIQSAKIKAEYPISYADSFAVSTAIREKSTVITGDPDFKRVEHLITVEWLSADKIS